MEHNVTLHTPVGELMPFFVEQRRIWRGLAVAFSVSAVFACGSTTEPVNPTVNLDVAPATGTNAQFPPAATVTVTQGTVAVTGYLTTPYTCYDVAATEQVSGSTLIVRVTASKHASSCAAALATFRFIATAKEVPSTISHVRVEQVGAVVGTPSVLLDQPITVP